MQAPQFDDSLKVGHALIDDQHQWLFSLAATVFDKIGTCDLQDASSDESCEDAIDDALLDALYGLSDYVTEHFSDEEALMRENGFPGVGPHASLHQDLASRVTVFLSRHINGDDVAAAELVAFFTTWLTDHIKTHDREFVEWLSRG
jgi:hemerythrin-like metal-binding protein